MMQGVTFGSLHSYTKWKLMLMSRPVISPPVPKTRYVDVPGADGALDMSETQTGYMLYKNRKITFTFVMMADRDEWPAIYSDIMDTLHGKKVDITLDNDPLYYYTGRVTVGEWDAVNVKTATLTMTADVLPFKTNKNYVSTYKNISVTNSKTIVVTGTGNPEVPSFVVTQTMNLIYDGKSHVLTTGSAKSYSDIIIRRGENRLTFSGTGTVTINYKGGRF